MLKAKKGFSLIELLVVIAIIGVLSAVGITAYSGYTADAKLKVTTSQHKQLVSFLNAESAKCAGGSGDFGFLAANGSSTSTACTAAWTVALIKVHVNSGMKMNNAYAPDVDFAIASHSATTQGSTVISLNGTSAVVTTRTVGSTDIVDTIARY